MYKITIHPYNPDCAYPEEGVVVEMPFVPNEGEFIHLDNKTSEEINKQVRDLFYTDKDRLDEYRSHFYGRSNHLQNNCDIEIEEKHLEDLHIDGAQVSNKIFMLKDNSIHITLI